MHERAENKKVMIICDECHFETEILPIKSLTLINSSISHFSSCNSLTEEKISYIVSIPKIIMHMLKGVRKRYNGANVEGGPVGKHMRILWLPVAALVAFTALAVFVLGTMKASGVSHEDDRISGGGNSPAREEMQPWPTPDPASMIFPDVLHAFDNFGASLAYADGLLAVGAPNTDLGSARNAGAVYLFEKRGKTWQQVFWLTPDPVQEDGRFGSALAFNGETLAVSAPYAFNPEGGNASGAVYLFTKKGEWTQTQRLSPPDSAPFDLFGSSLALSKEYLAVGAAAADGSNGERDAGAVYIYRGARQDWRLQARLGTSAAPFDHFGQALAFSGDELLVGAPDADVGQNANAGQVYVYSQARGVWTEQARLTSGEVRSQARFGMALSVQGAQLAVLAPQEYQKPGPMPPHAFGWESAFGVVHLFQREGEGWTWQARLFRAPADEQDVLLVNSAAITTAGGRTYLALSGYGRGKVLLYELRSGTWDPLPEISLENMTLISGQPLISADGQLLLGDHFYEPPQTGSNVLQSAGVVWIVDWEAK